MRRRSRSSPTVAAAIALALDEARQGDAVVIAGKGHEQGQEFADRKLPFDDREVAREALRARGRRRDPAPVAELEGLGAGCEATADERDRRPDRLAARRARRSLRRHPRRARLRRRRRVHAAPLRRSCRTTTLAAMAALGARRARPLRAREVVGITGSTGKTSTKDILAALCPPAARTIAAEASYNDELGVPLTLARSSRTPRSCVARARDARARPDRATSRDRAADARRDHRRRARPPRARRDVAGVAQAKAELLDALPPGRPRSSPPDAPRARAVPSRDDLEATLRVGDDARLRSWTDEPPRGGGARWSL